METHAIHELDHRKRLLANRLELALPNRTALRAPRQSSNLDQSMKYTHIAEQLLEVLLREFRSSLADNKHRRVFPIPARALISTRPHKSIKSRNAPLDLLAGRLKLDLLRRSRLGSRRAPLALLPTIDFSLNSRSDERFRRSRGRRHGFRLRRRCHRLLHRTISTRPRRQEEGGRTCCRLEAIFFCCRLTLVIVNSRSDKVPF